MRTVLLADDHPVMRLGLRALVEGRGEFRIVGEVGNGLEVAAEAERLRPDVLVLDLVLPGLGGMEALRQVRVSAPATRVVVLSMRSEEPYVLEALRAGAAGYVVKGAQPDELLQALREVLLGRRYLSPPLMDRAVERYASTPHPTPDPYDTLTEREREVLVLTARGNSGPQIAELLFISPRTVESHRSALCRKLDLRSQADLIRFAYRRGLLPEDG